MVLRSLWHFPTKKILGNLPGVIPSASFLHNYCNSFFCSSSQNPRRPQVSWNCLYSWAKQRPGACSFQFPVSSQFEGHLSYCLLSSMDSTTTIFPSKPNKKCELSWQWLSEGIWSLLLCSLLWSIWVECTRLSPVTPIHCSQSWNLPWLFLLHTHIFVLIFSVFFKSTVVLIVDDHF